MMFEHTSYTCISNSYLLRCSLGGLDCTELDWTEWTNELNWRRERKKEEGMNE
jgi:hypothetical protein